MSVYYMSSSMLHRYTTMHISMNLQSMFPKIIVWVKQNERMAGKDFLPQFFALIYEISVYPDIAPHIYFIYFISLIQFIQISMSRIIQHRLLLLNIWCATGFCVWMYHRWLTISIWSNFTTWLLSIARLSLFITRFVGLFSVFVYKTQTE